MYFSAWHSKNTKQISVLGITTLSLTSFWGAPQQTARAQRLFVIRALIMWSHVIYGGYAVLCFIVCVFRGSVVYRGISVTSWDLRLTGSARHSTHAVDILTAHAHSMTTAVTQWTLEGQNVQQPKRFSTMRHQQNTSIGKCYIEDS